MARSVTDAQVAAFASTVRRASDRQIDRFMATPLGRTVLRQMFRVMPRRLARQRVGDLRATMDFRITRRPNRPPEVYRVAIADGRCAVGRGGDGEPDAAIELSPATFLRLASGELSGPQLYMTGRAKISGDLMIAARMAGAFEIPSAKRQTAERP